ncbi:EG45-like domain containing protein [Hibiscus syriacus]|nr:EG45-like domain containing protein [Hibiscus syriacus]
MAKVKSAIMMMMIMAMAMAMAMVASAAPGTATFYTPPYVPSSCNGFQNDGVMIAAASDAIWNNRAACNTNYRVRCTGPTNAGVPQPCRGDSVVVKVVDYCPPPGCRGTIDLSQEAFSVIADPNAGKINIEYERV